jgi:predicted alpha/beta-fold hydrolase
MTAGTNLPSYAPSAYRPRFTGGHKQTLWAWARRRHFPDLPAPEARYFDVASDARVLAHCHWQTDRAAHPAILLLHGLEGSSMAHYMVGIADKAWREGWNVVRLNQRNCGGTEHLSRGLYHSGLTSDPLHVLQEIIAHDGIKAVIVAGYSLGGNLALKMAGDLAAQAPAALKAVCAVSPTMDLARCVAALERRQNFAYQFNFVRNLKSRMRRKASAFPALYDLEQLGRVWTVRQFDEYYTAPHHGFRDASDYYHRASALRVIDRIAVPTLVVTAADDPFVPPEPFTDPVIQKNPRITVALTQSGGHCAYLAAPTGTFDGYWVEQEIIRFGRHHLAATPSRLDG